MYIDLNTVETAAPLETKYDLCVCGSGPAGMTVARKAAAGGARVLLLEAGDFEPTAASMDVYRGRNAGDVAGLTYHGIESARLRYFGGTSGHWAGMCGVLDPIDFEARDGRRLPGWPITRNDVYAHLEEASDILDVSGADFSDRKSAEPLANELREYRFHRSAPTRFGEKFRSELGQSEQIDVALNANVVGLSLDESGARVTDLTIANYAGRRFTITAPAFVIAFGALETARFLLIADRQNNGALTARTDFIGRCFMEHFSLAVSRFVGLKPGFWQSHPRLALKFYEDRLRALGLGNSVMTLTTSAAPRDYGRLAPVRQAARRFFCSSAELASTARRFADFTCPGDGLVTVMMEQEANPESRITLDAQETDQFGLPRLVLDWRVTDLDRRTIIGLTTELGKDLAQADLGRIRIFEDVLAEEAGLGLHSHQMGTTRMSVDAKTGVVDRDCKMHGLDNLFVAGASVFSTGGGSNPTMTVVSLALRLGAHLTENVLSKMKSTPAAR